jgi:peroxiredoxin
MANTDVWCLLIDHAKKLDGAPFPVAVSPKDTVAHLKTYVKNRKKPDVNSFRDDELVVWKGDGLFVKKKRKQLQGLIDVMDLSDEDEALGVGEEVLQLGLDLSNKEILLVQMPGAFHPMVRRIH